MKGDTKVLEILNRVLLNELTAINQYFLHSRMYKNWGLSKLAEKEYSESLEEMRHASSIMERILFLEGLPMMQNLGSLHIGANIGEALKGDLKLEHIALDDLRPGIAYCEQVKDYASRNLLASILKSEEEHVDWLETQLELMSKIGLENYTQSQI